MRVIVSQGSSRTRNPGLKDTIPLGLSDNMTRTSPDPVGIAGQVYSGPGGRSFDAVIVAGDRMESFHDQRWCFKAQGWDLGPEEDAKLKTKSWGEIPVKVVQISKRGFQSTYAVFTFRGPTKFHSDIPNMSQDYFFFAGMRTPMSSPRSSSE